MINSFYGKERKKRKKKNSGQTSKNVRKRIVVRLVTNEKDFLKCTSKPARITHKNFDKNYAAIHEIKPV